MVAPHLKSAVQANFKFTEAEGKILDIIAPDAKFLYVNTPPMMLLAVFRFMLCKGNDLDCAINAMEPFEHREHEIQALELAMHDISNFDLKVSGSVKEDREILNKSNASTPPEQIDALKYRIEQRTIVQWHVEWMNRRIRDLVEGQEEEL